MINIFNRRGGITMFCKNCGTDVTGMKYCPNCGTCINKNETSEPNDKLTKKKLTITQVKGISLSVVFTAWGLLLITNSLLPYITAEIRYDFSDYKTFSYLYPLLYFVCSVLICASIYMSLKSSNYINTPQYTLTKILALNKSNHAQIILFVLLLQYAIYSQHELANGTLWTICVVVLIVCCILWGYWWFTLRTILNDNKKMVLVAVYISLREFWISFLLFLIASILLSLISSSFLGFVYIGLIFVYPALRYINTKKVLKNVYKI